ncbi:MAG: hypothetical protein FWF90_17375 [Promicromonosporaceae bacterium]|nr:hypothetical protein [Promicromonosporaceae bacterium]
MATTTPAPTAPTQGPKVSAKLQAAFTKHKGPVLACAAAVVLFLAWRARKGAGGDTTSSTTSLSTTSTPVTGGGGATPAYYTAGTGAYDSTSSDVYNALQPQIEYLQQLASQIPVNDPTAGSSSTSSSSPIDKGRALSAADQLVRGSASGTIYRVESDGTTTPISSATWSAFRNTAAGAGYAVQQLTGDAYTNITRAASKSAI